LKLVVYVNVECNFLFCFIFNADNWS